MISKTDLPFLHRSTFRRGPHDRARALTPAFLFSLTSSLALATAAPAATPPRYQLHIASKSRSEALIDLGVQARVTLGGAQACVGKSPALSGAMTLRQALSKLTAGACQFEILDAATVRVTALPRPASPPPAARVVAVVHETAAIDEVLVTATKRRTRLRSAPGGISVVGSGRLIDTGAVDTTSISQQTAGFFTTNLGAARNKIMLRGLSDGTFTGRTQQTVATYLDNIPLTYNAPDPDLRLIDVERVEVLRGPQGSLYGSGSLSGVYRIVSRKPDLETMSGFALASIAATESGSPSQKLEGMVNLPLVQDRAALRVALYSDAEGGYVDDVNLRLSNVDRTTRRGGRAALALRLNDTWSLNISTTRQNLRSTDTQYTTPSLGGQRRANQVRETHKNEFAQGAVTLSGEGDWGQFQSSTGYVDHRFASRFDATAALAADSPTAIELGLFDETSRIKMLAEDAVWSSPETGRFRWLAGLYGLVSQEDGTGELRARTTTDPSRLVYLEARRDRRRELAIYGEATYDLAWGWTVSLGGRGFSTTVRTTSQVQASPPGVSRSFDKQSTFSGVSPKLTLQRPWGDSGMLYLLTSEGYRSGGFNTGGTNALSALRSSFKPDHLRNYEIGGSAEPFKGRMTVRAALFHDVWTDIQTDQYLTSGLSYTANVGDGRNTGLELETVMRPTDRLTLSANALFNRPRLTKVDPTFASAAQSALPGVPDLSAGLLIRHETALSEQRGLTLTAQLGYIGHSRLTFDRRFSPRMGGYVTGRLGAQVTSGYWRVAAAVTNPANASSDTFSYGNPFSFGQVRQVTPLRPRTWSLDVSRAF
jgi:outer membrane receptor protein involved in Fe transport